VTLEPGATKEKNSFNGPLPEATSQKASPAAEHVQKNEVKPGGISSTSWTELANVLPMFAKLTV
jgi:hypothetical protein